MHCCTEQTVVIGTLQTETSTKFVSPVFVYTYSIVVQKKLVFHYKYLHPTFLVSNTAELLCTVCIFFIFLVQNSHLLLFRNAVTEVSDLARFLCKIKLLVS